jgi:AbrB family looped-hinge helix DNA binding protein
MKEEKKQLRARVAEKGQVVIPKALRDRLGIRPGQELEFVEDHGRLVVTRVPAHGPVERVYGSWGRGGSTDAFMREIRGEPDAVDPEEEGP